MTDAQARRQRVRFLADWAMRDRRFALRQARLDEREFPGIAIQVKDVLDLREEFARRDGNWSMVMGELTRLAPAVATTAPSARAGRGR